MTALCVSKGRLWIVGVEVIEAQLAVVLVRFEAARSKRRSLLHRRHRSVHACWAPQVGQRNSSRDGTGIGLRYV